MGMFPAFQQGLLSTVLSALLELCSLSAELTKSPKGSSASEQRASHILMGRTVVRSGLPFWGGAGQGPAW